jgi:adenine nucleotide transporter 17
MAVAQGAGRLLSETEQVSSLRMDSLTNAVAGGLASIIAFSLVYPLDQLRTFQQVEGADRDALEAGEQCPAVTSWYAVTRRIWVAINVLVEKHGVGVLYRGLRPMLLSMGTSNFVYFYAHSLLSGMLQQYKRRTGRDLGYLGQLSVNSMAGVINVLATTPLWTASVRAKLSSDREAQNVLQVLGSIYRREGVAGLWSGTVPSLFLVCNPAIQFLLYGVFKTQALALRKVVPGAEAPTLSSAEAFLFGAAAKGAATVISYPLQVWVSGVGGG